MNQKITLSKRVLLLFVSGCLTVLGISAQTSALYGTSLISTETTADWYFICNATDKSVLTLSASYKLQSETVPFNANRDQQFWRFEQSNGKTYLINKGTTGGLNANEVWDTKAGKTEVLLSATGSITIHEKVLQLTATGATLAADKATPLLYVKAPIGDGNEWVQLKSYRSKNITILNEAGGMLKWTSTDNATQSEQRFRLLLDTKKNCYNLCVKTQSGKRLQHNGINTNNVSFTTTSPTELLLHPLVDSPRTGYIQFSLKGNEKARLDYSSNGLIGFYDKSGSAFGTHTNDGFRFLIATYAEGDFAVLNTALEKAQNVLKTTSEGKNPGQYSSAAREELNNAIMRAQTVLKDPTIDATKAEAAAQTLNEAVSAYQAKPNTLKFSIANDTTWYYIISAAKNNYCKGKVIASVSDKDGDAMQFLVQKVDPNMLWCFISNGTGKVAIRNHKTGRYFAKTVKNGTLSLKDFAFDIKTYANADGSHAFTLQAAGDNPVHAQEAGSAIVSWSVADGNASLWNFKEISAEELVQPMTITSSNVEQGTVMTGIGNTNVSILRSALQVEGFKGETILNGVKGDVTGTTKKEDILAVKAYLAPDYFELNPAKAVLLGSTTPQADGTFNIPFTAPTRLQIGPNYLWITLDISENAKEGNAVDAQIKAYTYADGTQRSETNGNPAHTATIFTTESTLFHPGDANSRYYRIPAITTAKNNTLVAVCDRRWNSEADLPNPIDVVARHSTDNGKTWSEPITIAGTAALGGDYGHGDPAIVTDRITGNIIVLVAAKKGFFNCSPSDPIRIEKIVSTDNGVSWQAPVDITDMVYGDKCTNNTTSKSWNAAFVSSGAMIQTRSGRIMAAMPVRETSNGACTNHLLYSDDHGITWHASNGNAANDANEAKIVERNNGDILISVRHPGNRYMNISTDKGQTWGQRWTNQTLKDPGCDADMILYTSTKDGYNKNRMLHTTPWAGGRQNVSVLLSYDEGMTWGNRKSLCVRGSAYSTLTILADGTIGCFLEDSSISGGFTMRYVRFSLDWLSSGTDTFTPAEDPSQITSSTNATVTVESNNGFISVKGTDAPYTITSLDGKHYPQNTKLIKGLYLVRVNGTTLYVKVK